MLQILIVADDLSGAADCGIACVGAGLNTIVVLGNTNRKVHADVLSIDADTRGIDQEAAAKETGRLIEKHLRFEKTLLFKKLDSTLRGNVATELAAALASKRHQNPHVARAVAVVAPAFPASGRTTVNGQQLLRGRPAHEAKLPGEHIACNSNLLVILESAGMSSTLLRLKVIRSGSNSLRTAMIELGKSFDVLLCDAETDQDLSTIALASVGLGHSTVWAGSAGLAYHLPRAAGLVGTSTSVCKQPLASGPTLFVIGSLSSASQQQAQELSNSKDIITIAIPPKILLDETRSADALDHKLGFQRAVESNSDVVLMLASEYQVETAPGRMLTNALANMTARYADTFGALVATGGETARSVLQAWGVTRLRLVRELETGLPFSVTESWTRRLPVVTKAGSFGDPQTLLHCRQFLQGMDRNSTATFSKEEDRK